MPEVVRFGSSQSACVAAADEGGDGGGEAAADGGAVGGVGLEEVGLGAVEEAVGRGRGEAAAAAEVLGEGAVAAVGGEESGSRRRRRRCRSGAGRSGRSRPPWTACWNWPSSSISASSSARVISISTPPGGPSMRSAIQPRRTEGARPPSSGGRAGRSLAAVEVDEHGGDLIERQAAAIDVVPEPALGLGRQQGGQLAGGLDAVVDDRPEGRPQGGGVGQGRPDGGDRPRRSRRRGRGGGRSRRRGRPTGRGSGRARPRRRSSRRIETAAIVIRASRARRARVGGAVEVAGVVGGVADQDEELGRQVPLAAGRPVQVVGHADRLAGRARQGGGDAVEDGLGDRAVAATGGLDAVEGRRKPSGSVNGETIRAM